MTPCTDQMSALAGPALQAVEERAFNAWPAQQNLLLGGWLLRLSQGYTKRANSANALQPGARLDALLPVIEALYARQGLPAVFRISPLAAPQADAQLERAGYARFDPSLVLCMPLAGRCFGAAGVEIAPQPTPAWLAGFAQADGLSAAHQATHHAMLQAIAWPAAFATVRHQGQAMGWGLAVLERGAVGFYDLVIDPAFRGQGQGRALMGALLHWAMVQGATSAYLQVRAPNAAARRLYAALGFACAYRYHYRVPPVPSVPR